MRFDVGFVANDFLMFFLLLLVSRVCTSLVRVSMRFLCGVIVDCVARRACSSYGCVVLRCAALCCVELRCVILCRLALSRMRFIYVALQWVDLCCAVLCCVMLCRIVSHRIVS